MLNYKFRNAAGDRESYKYIPDELAQAGITIVNHDMPVDHPEVITQFTGELEVPGGKWFFHRNWYYWVAYSKSSLPMKFAKPLHEINGQDIRVSGHCGCPSPEEWYGPNAEGVNLYHVDTQNGLNILAATLKSWNLQHCQNEYNDLGYRHRTSNCVGIDFHEVINKFPKQFLQFMNNLRKERFLIYIITGGPHDDVNKELDQFGFVKFEHYTRMFTITDTLRSMMVPVQYDDKGNPWASDDDWWSAKFKICKHHGIGNLIDDKTRYFDYFDKNNDMYKCFAFNPQMTEEECERFLGEITEKLIYNKAKKLKDLEDYRKRH